MKVSAPDGVKVRSKQQRAASAAAAAAAAAACVLRCGG